MDELRIKDAFVKVKEDIYEIKEQLALFSQELVELKAFLSNLHSETLPHQTDKQTGQHINIPSSSQIQHIRTETPAHSDEIPALQHLESSTPAHNLPLYALKSPNSNISTGNDGVPALKALPEVLETLNAIKEEVRIKFKHLTKQEIIVFSAIYSLEEQSFSVDYSLLAQKLSLTESSIRDYVQRLIKKGLPLIKFKENNKKIFISISPEFKKLVSLSTLHTLAKLKES